MIENFIDSALIIDDKKEEVEKLISLFEEKDIWVKYYSPSKIPDKKFRNRKIIFLDLLLDDSKNEKDNISTIIRPMLAKNLGKDYGTYGIVLWTRHLDWINEFKEKIKNDINRYTLPLFIVGLDKNPYLRSGNYNSIFDDLNIMLKENIAANFFIAWSSLVNKGKDLSIDNIYSSINDYEIQNDNLKFILFQLAKNLTGIPMDKIEKYPLHIDAFVAFNDMMNYEIVKELSNNLNFFENPKQIQFKGISNETRKYSRKGPKEFFYENKSIANDDHLHSRNIAALNAEIDKIFSQINSRTLFDEYNIDNDNIMPGNVYEILNEENQFNTPEKPKDSIPVLVEMTPKCDFSNKKNLNHRVLAGLITKYDKSKLTKLKDNFYKEIYPVKISNLDFPQMILFDLRVFGSVREEELLDNKKYKLLLRIKDRLFADLLQKLSSHMARLGLSIIH